MFPPLDIEMRAVVAERARAGRRGSGNASLHRLLTERLACLVALPASRHLRWQTHT